MSETGYLHDLKIILVNYKWEKDTFIREKFGRQQHSYQMNKGIKLTCTSRCNATGRIQHYLYGSLARTQNKTNFNLNLNLRNQSGKTRMRNNL